MASDGPLVTPAWLAVEMTRGFARAMRFNDSAKLTTRARVKKDGLNYVCRWERSGIVRCGACLRGVVWPRRIKFCRVCCAQKVGRWNLLRWGLPEYQWPEAKVGDTISFRLPLMFTGS